MNGQGALIGRFIDQELNGAVRSVLESALEERLRSSTILFTELEFNCFDVFLDFEQGIVALQDALSAGEGSYVEMSMDFFVSACSLALG